MEAHLLIDEPPQDLLDDAQSVYLAAFAAPPYNERPDQAAAFRERVQRYARQRDGLRLVLVHDHGRPAGVGLYERRGWRILTDRFPAGDATVYLMARPL